MSKIIPIKPEFVDNSTWNQKFKENCTSVAFSLSLSKRMVFVLLAIDFHKGYPGLYCTSPGGVDTWIATTRSLIERGLVIFHRIPKKPSIWKLSPAGELVVELLKFTGFSHKCKEATKNDSK